ncbi:hypothetical protein E2F50_12915 [Rhizobium deserti]|uniref:DUF6894 domain-containing protein n=1 Tax=Rhizobium deserti TaxID=2547961 RepID=A0A4R5UGV2_9HYPH|nr:hypothetical protein [Rhizobium deserti]TDK35161.1 hypothetical protein E2F50_12915 [Rhizobium deserti]
MPLFYFNIRKNDANVEDIEGEELPDLGTATAYAEESILAMVAEQLKAKSSVDVYGIEITNAEKKVIAVVSTGEVLPKVIPPTILPR